MALDTVLPYAHEVGFFLHQNRFRSACAHLGFGAEDPPAALLSAVCLWAACLSPSASPAEPLAHEPTLLARALHLAPGALSSGHRLQILHGIQTEVLLCAYFLHKGRLVEAQYHLSLAASHVVLGDLAGLRSARGARAQRAQIYQDPIEEGELVSAFWTVLAMDKIWSSALNFPSNFTSEGPPDVDTPWPLEMDAYEQ
ncbi:hypothetical protein B0H15DRAFT_888016, partial [Mycena belliarum]